MKMARNGAKRMANEQDTDYRNVATRIMLPKLAKTEPEEREPKDTTRVQGIYVVHDDY
jgi:hypothetical protein